jgi:hypothetical protein
VLRRENHVRAHTEQSHTHAEAAAAESEMHFERPSVYRGISGNDCCATVSSSKYAILEIHHGSAREMLCETVV